MDCINSVFVYGVLPITNISLPTQTQEFFQLSIYFCIYFIFLLLNLLVLCFFEATMSKIAALISLPDCSRAL